MRKMEYITSNEKTKKSFRSGYKEKGAGVKKCSFDTFSEANKMENLEKSRADSLISWSTLVVF